MKKIRINEVKNVIKYKINPKKAPGYDLITGKVLKELSQKGLRAITQIYNAIIRNEYFPCQWKVGQIIMIAKPGKNSDDIASFSPISLLPILSKILEKILLQRLTPIIEKSKLIPSH
jgi:potassium voltage-gated channel Eag-related subfamily H protein 8